MNSEYSELCMNCVHFGIDHPQVNLFNSPSATPEQITQFVQTHIISHGKCLRKTRINPVNGAEEYPLALAERTIGSCGLEGKFYQSHPPAPDQSEHSEHSGDSDGNT